MSKPDGGPAFPINHLQKNIPGMTLRDWFAGKALSSFLQSEGGEFNPSHYAKTAYQYADAMLAERSKP